MNARIWASASRLHDRAARGEHIPAYQKCYPSRK